MNYANVENAALLGNAVLGTTGNAEKNVFSGHNSNNSTAGGDRAFPFIGAAAFSGTEGELRYVQLGANTYVQGDVNGDGVADLEIKLLGLHTLVAGDFVL